MNIKIGVILLLICTVLSWGGKPATSQENTLKPKKILQTASENQSRVPITSVVKMKWAEGDWVNFEQMEHLYGATVEDPEGAEATVITFKLKYSNWETDKWVENELVQIELADWGPAFPRYDTVLALHYKPGDNGYQPFRKHLALIDQGWWGGTTVQNWVDSAWVDSITYTYDLDVDTFERTGFTSMELVDGNWAPSIYWDYHPPAVQPTYTFEWGTTPDNINKIPTTREIHYFIGTTVSLGSEGDSVIIIQNYEDTAWVNSKKITRTLNFNNTIVLTQTTSEWVEGAWVVKTHTTYTYDTVGELLEELTIMVDGADTTNLEKVVYNRSTIVTEVKPTLLSQNPIQFTQTNQGISISFLSQIEGDLDLAIYDVKGALVYKISQNNNEQGGLTWNYHGRNNQKVEAGIYYLKASTGNHTKQQTFFVQ